MISKELIKKLFIQELIKTNNLMSDDVKRHLESYDGRFSSILKENCIIAGEKGLPLCQDTGMVEIFAYVGTKTIIHEPLQNILDEAVKETYISNPTDTQRLQILFLIAKIKKAILRALFIQSLRTEIQLL